MLEEGFQAGHMVGVFMGDEDAFAVRDGQPQAGQRLQGGAAALANVNKKVTALVDHQGAVTRRTGI